MKSVIETERLLLRDWQLEDTAAAFAIYGDPEVVRFLGDGEPMPDLIAQRAWLAERIERHRSLKLKGLGAWALVERNTEKIVGTMLLKPLPPNNREIEVGWHLARGVWGRGYASEAGAAVLGYGFFVLKLEAIYAVIKPSNTRSVGVAVRLRMRWVERTTRYYDGAELDLFVIEREWFDRCRQTGL